MDKIFKRGIRAADKLFKPALHPMVVPEGVEMVKNRLNKSITLLAFWMFLTAALLACQEGEGLCPQVKPFSKGFLQVSDLHKIYWEALGSKNGIPVMVLHGGPGGSAGPDMAQFFDPTKFKIILFDQRGAGRSLPKGEWRENNTQLLMEDINKLRDHIGIEGKAILFGGSWGSTLAVAYAEAYPERVSGMVLRGIFLGTQKEIDHFYHGGVSLFFPENFKQLKSLLPHPESLDYPKQLFEMTQSDDSLIRERAVKGWAYYEIRMASLTMTHERCSQIVDHYDMTAFSVLENYYMMNRCFLKERQLLEDVHKIAHIPTYIVNGRYDVICPPWAAWILAAGLDKVRLEITMAGHTQQDPENMEAILRGVKWIAEQVARDA
jgi:proline iminopeptidase